MLPWKKYISKNCATPVIFKITALRKLLPNGRKFTLSGHTVQKLVWFVCFFPLTLFTKLCHDGDDLTIFGLRLILVGVGLRSLSFPGIWKSAKNLKNRKKCRRNRERSASTTASKCRGSDSELGRSNFPRIDLRLELGPLNSSPNKIFLKAFKNLVGIYEIREIEREMDMHHCSTLPVLQF
jgi:hypothetical protein